MDNNTAELQNVANSRDAVTLKQMVDLGMIPYEGAIKQKIDNSPEIQLHKAMNQVGLSEADKFELIANLLVMTNQV